jgi:DNA repair protein SbcC/Rad50
MLLQKLRLKNVRSYIDETINFQDGSTLLSGDIGCGKSTILLAIEFALFGTSRPDLPGEALLRKGTILASVELTFILNGQQIIIQRNLKKERDNIKQLAGYLIINDTKRDLTPVELKAEIISLLGYPEEFVTKNKNYIFRYSIYTPQEEMKFILQDNPEIRLDVLRKIFNIDKYKNIRENLQLWLKKMRTKIAILKTKLEDFEVEKEKLSNLTKEKETHSSALGLLRPELIKLSKDLNSQKDELQLLEKQQRQFIELKQQYQTNLTLIDEKNKQTQLLKNKQEQLQLEISELAIPEDTNLNLVQSEIKSLEEQKSNIFTKKSSLQEKLTYLQGNINQTQQETSQIKEGLSQLEEKENLKKSLFSEIEQKDSLRQKQLQLQELFEKTSQLVTKNQTLLNQSKEMKDKIASLDNCPTCLQKVVEGHKQSILSQEEQKVKQAENLLFELNKKKVQIHEQKENNQTKIEELILKENQLTRIKLELLQLNEKKESLSGKQEQLKSWVQENNQIMQQLQQLDQENVLSEIEQKLLGHRKVLDLFNKKNILNKHLQEVIEQLKLAQEKIKFLQQNNYEAETVLNNRKDLTAVIEEKKTLLEGFLEQEKKLSVKQAELQTNLDNTLRLEKELQTKVDDLKDKTIQLTRLKELYHWLEQHFAKLTYTIEKQVMLNIHHLFDQLFQEWFSMLIDDENIYSRLDDSFTPVIEQNGYEISFGNLSGGEKTSAALAYRLALNKVINDVIQEIKTKDIIILDEPTDGFSSEQLDKVRDVLERLNLKQTIIVSHETKIESFVENVVRVNKAGHESKVV